MTATATHPPAADLRTGDRPWPRRVFVAGLVVAAPLLLWVGRDHWFFLDEWLVLQRDGLTDPGYLDAHNGHWITVVALDYRLNFRLWGLGTYLPYQVPVVAAHLASAALLRIVMLRVGVRGWLATGAALVFVFLGSGRDNITFGFQISMTGSLLAGLALLLIADHAGPVDRRDLVGLLVGRGRADDVVGLRRPARGGGRGRAGAPRPPGGGVLRRAARDRLRRLVPPVRGRRGRSAAADREHASGSWPACSVRCSPR